MKRIIALASLLALVACGGMTPEQKIVGKWEAEMFDETMTVEFYENGTVYSVEEDETQNWSIEEVDEVLILTVWDPDRRDDAVEMELVFDGNDSATLSAEGMTSTLKRL